MRNHVCEQMVVYATIFSISKSKGVEVSETPLGGGEKGYEQCPLLDQFELMSTSHLLDICPTSLQGCLPPPTDPQKHKHEGIEWRRLQEAFQGLDSDKWIPDLQEIRQGLLRLRRLELPDLRPGLDFCPGRRKFERLDPALEVHHVDWSLRKDSANILEMLFRFAIAIKSQLRNNHVLGSRNPGEDTG